MMYGVSELVSPIKQHSTRIVLALAVAVLGTLATRGGTVRASTGHATQVNCSGYVRGMQVLAVDIQNFSYRAPTLLLAPASLQERGVARELQTVLHANGKPVDNFKVVYRMSDAMVSVYLAVDARESHRNFSKASALLDQSRIDLADVQILLREICLPSKIRHLPCTGSCVISLVGSGRVVARELPRISFVVPTNYRVRFGWNCQAASAGGKTFQIFFQSYGDAARLTNDSGNALGTRIVNAAGAQYSGTVVRDRFAPGRELLLVDAEQACQWQMTVSKG